MSLKKSWVLLVLILLAGIGFYFISTTRRDPIQQLASQLDGLISPDRIRQQVNQLAMKPHPAGTEENRKAGDAIIARLKALQLQVSTAEYVVSLYQPIRQQLFLTAPVSKEFHLAEKVLPEDPYSKIAENQIPYFAYSPDADIEADVIYANFGTRQDYAALKKLGMSVAGKIALVRAQGICRSMKAEIAEEEGVAGLLLYPELRDQGMSRAPFPAGPSLNPWTAQRGSLLKYYLSPGDTEHTRPSIPALPISAETALELFRNLKGQPHPEGWTGAMPVSYNVGPGPARVHLTIKGEIVTRKIRDIFALLPATNTVEPHLLLSGHYDAWVYGACDPGSGTATILETASVLSELHSKGWSPRRSIQFAFWDAEEFGLLGSAKWTEQNLEYVRNNIAAHFYVDSLRAQNFTAYISPGLHSALDRILPYVHVPDQPRTFADVRGEYALPGFSDDTAPMTGWAATPSARLGFGTYYSEYHSLYDDLKWMNEFCDPGFHYSTALVKILSLLTIEMSNEAVLPFRLSEISATATDKLSNANLHDPNLERAISTFDLSARRLEENLDQHKTIPEAKAIRLNRLLMQTMQSFLIDAKPFSQKNALIGPSPEEGCSGELLPDSQNPEKISLSISAFTKASHQLQEAAKILQE